MQRCIYIDIWDVGAFLSFFSLQETEVTVAYLSFA
jgi:hypothetical protein